jgi:hypothetical protein
MAVFRLDMRSIIRRFLRVRQSFDEESIYARASEIRAGAERVLLAV